jgi:hypothetical protein
LCLYLEAFDLCVAGVLSNGRGAYLIGQLNAVVVTDESRRIDDQLSVEPLRFEAEFVGAVGFALPASQLAAQFIGE